MISTNFRYGVSNADTVQSAGTFHAPAAHIPSAMTTAEAAAMWAVAAHAPQRKRRPAATDAFVNRGFD